MNYRHLITTLSVAMILGINAFAGNPYSYKGKTDSKAMGKEEVLENMVLNVEETPAGLAVSMKDYELLGTKGISITGIVKVNEKGEIIGFDKIDIKGAPGKVKDIKGTLTKEAADVRMTGKAGGLFNFDIRYTAKISK